MWVPACFCMHVCVFVFVCMSVCVCVKTKHPTVGLRGMELDKKLPSDTDFPNRLITLDRRVAPRLSDVCKMSTHIFFFCYYFGFGEESFSFDATLSPQLRVCLWALALSLSFQSQRMALYLLCSSRFETASPQSKSPQYLPETLVGSAKWRLAVSWMQ